MNTATIDTGTAPYPPRDDLHFESDDLDATEDFLVHAYTKMSISAEDGERASTQIDRRVHVTPRALQYMFRRYLDMTPMEYLRRVRMDHAHRELIKADAGQTTVQIVAARWGFAHTGRFAAMYREAYGRNPCDSLRG